MLSHIKKSYLIALCSAVFVMAAFVPVVHAANTTTSCGPTITNQSLQLYGVTQICTVTAPAGNIVVILDPQKYNGAYGPSDYYPYNWQVAGISSPGWNCSEVTNKGINCYPNGAAAGQIVVTFNAWGTCNFTAGIASKAIPNGTPYSPGVWSWHNDGTWANYAVQFPSCPSATVTCSTNSQCGTSGLTGSPFCQGGNVYQNYVTYTCNNPGTPSSSCTSSTSGQLQTTCTGNQTCSNGSCVNQNVTCSTNSQCGTNGLVGSPFCQGSGVYQNYTTYTCNNPGTASSYCSNSTTTQQQNTCTSNQTCNSGACVNQTVTCSTNSQCGINGLTGSPFCQSGNVYQNYVNWTCSNPGTSSSSCSSNTTAQLQTYCTGLQTCTNGSCVATAAQCSDGTDNDGDGKIDSLDPGCHFDLNVYNTASYEPNSTNEARSNVGTCSDGTDNNGDGKTDSFDPLCHADGNANNPGSYDGRRSESGSVACSSSTQCGASGLTGSPFCQGNGVYQNYATWTCNNPGTASSYCSSGTSAQLQNTCTGSQACSSGSCTGNTNTCTSNSYQSCYQGNVYWFNSCGQAQSVSQYCSSGTCNGSTCANTISSKTISSSELARNLSTGNLNWSATVYASPGDILEFKVTMKSNVNQTISNVTVKEIFPWQLLNWHHLTVDGLANVGDITTGVNIGSFAPSQQRVITYQAKLVSASNFSFGTTTLTDPVDVTSTDSGYAKQPTTPVTIIVNKQRVATTPTNVATGIGDDLANSFIIPLLLVILGFWLYTSKLVPQPRKWVRSLLEKNN